MKRVTRVLSHGAWTFLLFAVVAQAVIVGDTVWALIGLAILGVSHAGHWQEAKSLRERMESIKETLDDFLG